MAQGSVDITQVYKSKDTIIVHVTLDLGLGIYRATIHDEACAFSKLKLGKDIGARDSTVLCTYKDGTGSIEDRHGPTGLKLKAPIVRELVEKLRALAV